MEFSEYYVAYFDVLGYKEAFKKSEEVSVKLVRSIEKSIDLTKKIVSIVNSLSNESTDDSFEIEYKIFSDNILICYRETKNSFSELHLVFFLRLIATVQRIFFEGCKLVVRGGITKGPLYLTDDFVSGKALIDAVELENTAIYPRIVVDNCVLDILKSKIHGDDISKYIVEASCRDLLVKHTDDIFFLNYIISFDPWIWFPKNGARPKNIESVEEIEKNYSEGRLRKPIYNPECLEEVFVILKKHKDFVEAKINEFSQSSSDMAEETRLKILKKYLWLVSFHNRICKEMYDKPEFRINLKSEFNERTLAFDVSVS